MGKYHTVKILTAIPSGKHAGEASAMVRWRTTAGVGSWREKEMFREVKRMRAEKSVKGLEVSLCQVKGNLKLKSQITATFRTGLVGGFETWPNCLFWGFKLLDIFEATNTVFLNRGTKSRGNSWVRSLSYR